MNDHPHRPPFDDFDADAFVGDVLGRTSGSACERATDQLNDLMANRLAGLDRQLVQAHLEHCRGCRELAVTLGWLAPLLPQMAVIEPGPEFMAGVLARTSQSRHTVSASASPAGVAGLMDRVGRWWEQQIMRPQFAVQAAYVVTVVLVLFTATPGSPLRGVPGRALTVVSAGPSQAPVIGPAVVQASSWLDSRAAAVVEIGRHQARSRWHSWQAGLAQRAARTTDSRSELSNHWASLVVQARSRELGGIGYELLATLRTGRTVWQQWWQTDEIQSGS